MWEALGGIAAVLGALAGIIKWLLGAYFKKAEQLEEVKSAYQAQALVGLQETVEAHKKELRVLGQKLEENTRATTIARTELQTVSGDLRKYIEGVEKTASKIHSEVIALGKDLAMVKGRPNAKKADS